MTHMIKQVIENVANHLHLLLVLQVIVNLTGALILHDLVSAFRLDTLQVGQDVSRFVSKPIKARVHLMLLLWVKASLNILCLLPVWILLGILRVHSAWLSMILKIAELVL